MVGGICEVCKKKQQMTNFAFLQTEWPQLFADAQKAEALVIPDPRTACFYARRTLESAVAWLYKSDAALKLPYQDNLSALIHEPTFKTAVGAKIFVKAKLTTAGLHDLRARAVPSLLLAGSHVRQGRQARRWACL